MKFSWIYVEHELQSKFVPDFALDLALTVSMESRTADNLLRKMIVSWAKIYKKITY